MKERMGILMRKSPVVVVMPSSPVTAANINLSPYDMPILTLPTPAIFLVFNHPIHKPIECVKRGLSQALVHYHPFAGRLGNEMTAHIRFSVEEAGVPFLGASADCGIKDIGSFDESLLEELAMYYPKDICSLTDPLLMVQVTEFSCGGFIVGVTINHSVADGYGIGQFLQAVGELSRGLPSPSVVPVRWDASVMPADDGSLADYLNIQPSEVVLQDITISSSIITRIKDRFVALSHGRRSCTTFKAVAAVLWRCCTRAIISNLEAFTGMVFPVEVHKYIGAKDGYYGNCLAGQPVLASMGTVANEDIISLVKMIQFTKDQLNKRRDIHDVKNEALVAAVPLEGYNLFAISSGRNIGLELADFGGGIPARVLLRCKRDRVCIPTFFLMPPRKAKVAGVKILSLSVKEEHAEAFLQELASLEPTMAKL